MGGGGIWELRGREKKLSPSLTSCPTPGPAARPQATPGRSGHPLPPSGPQLPLSLKDYNSRQALRSRCCWLHRPGTAGTDGSWSP